MRLTSGLGGIAPGRISRQIAAMKQKALNSTNALPANFVSPGCMTSARRACAPTPEASAARLSDVSAHGTD